MLSVDVVVGESAWGWEVKRAATVEAASEGGGIGRVGGEGEGEDGFAGEWRGREMGMCRRMYVLMCLIVILNGKWGGGRRGS